MLLAVEFGGTSLGNLPLAWCVERPPMRTFYTALGHFVAAYVTPMGILETEGTAP